MKSLTLEGRTALVTGAAGHLGEPICRQLAGAGARVFCNGRNAERVAALVASIREAGGAADALPGDVASEDFRREAVDRIAAAGGRLDGLVNNAYSGAVGTIESVTTDQMRSSLELNLVAPFELTRALLPLLKASTGASVVNVGSMYGTVSPDGRIYGDSGYNNPPFYGAGKAGLVQLTRYLACHWGRENVRVNAVSPGPFPPLSLAEDQPEFHAKLVAKCPMGRLGLPDEVAGAVQFLLSDAASYVTGANLPIDGGWTAGSN